MRFDAQCVEHRREAGVVSIVVDNETGIDPEGLIAVEYVDGVDVATDLPIGLEDREVGVRMQQMRRDESRYPAANDGNALVDSGLRHATEFSAKLSFVKFPNEEGAIPRYTTVITSVWDLDEAFGFMADFSNAAEWDPGVTRARRVGTGEVGLGSEFDLTVPVAGRDKILRYRITEFEPGRRVTFNSTTSMLRSVDTLSFEARPAGCEMTYDADLQLTGVAAIANPLLALTFRKIGDRARDSLRRMLGSSRDGS